MSEPVRIIVTADTAQAAAALKGFCAESASGLRSVEAAGGGAGQSMMAMQASSRLVSSSMREVSYVAILLGGTHYPMLTTAAFSVTAGFRAINAMAALTRIQFVALLAPLAAVTAGFLTIAAAAFPEVYFWLKAKKAAEQEAAAATAEHNRQMEFQIALLKQIGAARAAGLLTYQQADLLTGMAKEGEAGRKAAANELLKQGLSEPALEFNELVKKLSESGKTFDAERLKALNEYNSNSIKIEDAKNVAGPLTDPTARAKAILLNYSDYMAKLADIDFKEQEKKNKRTETGLALDEQVTKAGLQEERAEWEEHYKRGEISAGDYFAKLRSLAQQTATAGLTPLRSELAEVDSELAALATKKAGAVGPAEQETLKTEEETLLDKKHEIETKISLALIEQKKTGTEILGSERESQKVAEQRAQAEAEIARAKVEAQITGIEGNPLMTDLEKTRAELPLKQELLRMDNDRISALQQLAATTKDPAAQLEAEKQLNEVMQRRARLVNDIETSQMTGNFAGEVSLQWKAMLSQVQNTSRDMATMAMSPFIGMKAGLTSAFDTLLEKGSTAKQFFGSVALSIGQSMIRAFSQMAADFVMKHVIMRAAMLETYALQVALGARAMLISAANAIKSLIMWIPSAIAAGISSYGAAAIIGTAAVIGVLAAYSAGAFAEGGYTGGGGKYDVAGVVHAGEYVFPADRVDQIGVGNLAALHHGAGNAGGGGGGSTSVTNKNNVEIATFFDPQKVQEHMERSAAHEKFIVDIMGRNIHRFR